MFGIGKKSESGKTGAKGEMKGTEDEIQFDFEENDKLPFDDDENFADDDFVDEDFADEPSRKGMRQPLSQRTLLLVLLLLLALGGGGYYYLNSISAPPSPEPSAPVKKRVSVQPESPVPVVVTPVPVVVTPVQDPQPATAMPEQSAPVTKGVAETISPAPDAAAAVPSESKRATASKPAVSQPYTLTAGAFVSQKNQREVERKIRRLGYTPQVQTVDSMVPMTRLLLGIYDDPAAAQARRQELSAQLPGFFALQEGEKVALYAGSFQNLDQARRLADQLYLRGILVDEETISVPMSLKKISFGSFSSRAEAEKAAKHAAAAGLTAQVVKR